MNIDLRGNKIPPSQVAGMISTVRAAFRDVGHRIARIVVLVPDDRHAKHAPRNCVVEVHMADGHVELVQERQRRLGSALRRAVQRAWQAAARWIARQHAQREVLHLPGPRALPVLMPSQSRAGRKRD